MKLKIILLDTDTAFCNRMLELTNVLNNGGKHLIDLTACDNVNKYYHKLNNSYDLSVIEYNINYEKLDGCKIAQHTLSRYPKMVTILQSRDKETKMALDSWVLQDELACSIIYKKFLRLRKDRPHNILEVFLADGKFSIE